ALRALVDGGESDRHGFHHRGLPPLSRPMKARSMSQSLLPPRVDLQLRSCALSAVIRRGIASGTFRPRCTSWAIRRLPFAIVAGGCIHWVFGLTPGPSLRAATAVAGVLEALRPKPRNADEGRVVGKANRSAD